MGALASVPAAGGLTRGLDRWFVPQRFTAWTDRRPDRYRLDLPLFPTVLLTCSPEDCRAIFTERDGALLFGEGLRRFAPHEPMFGHDAIAALDGEDHARFRRQLTAAFHGDALKGYQRGIVATTKRHMAGWTVGEPVPFADLARALARDVIAETVLGVTEPGRAARLRSALDSLERTLDSLEFGSRFATAILLRGRWAPFPRIQAIHERVAAVTREEIAARRAGASGTGGGRDCLARFLELDAGGELGMSEDEIVSAMRVLVIAGWATTATTLAWAIERLARHPGALARCRADALSADGPGRYLTATIQETLRLRPPVPITVRYVARDFELPGLRVPRGTLLAADIERMHHRADVYVNPRGFRPERFLESQPGTYTWLPFGGGVHRCIGAGFALSEARLVLATLLRTFTVAPTDAAGEPSRRRTLVTTPARRARVTLLSPA